MKTPQKSRNLFKVACYLILGNCLLQKMGNTCSASGLAENTASGSSYFYYHQPVIPRDCQEVYHQCPSSQNASGVYFIKPEGLSEPFEVFCNNSVDSGGWTDGGININSDCSRRCSCNDNQLTCENIECSGDATCQEIEDSYQCHCNGGFVGNGRDCVVAAIDCLELYNAGMTTDGVYTIYPTSWAGSGFEVYCEMESNGGGWTVFQRRMNGSEDFYRSWTDYKEGFGMPTNEFWLGNDKIHTLTHKGNYQLRIDALNSEGGSVYQVYSTFRISDENDKYRLSVGTESGNTVGNAFNHNKGQPFSTYDQDNDPTSAHNCAEEHRGAWWYGYFTSYCYLCWKWPVGNSRCSYCTDSNLNGDYQETGVGSVCLWYSNGNPNLPECGIIRTEMKLRPV